MTTLHETDAEFTVEPGDEWWWSEPFDVTPFDWYRLTFESKTAKDAYWFAVYVDASGADMPADHSGGVDASDDWTANEFFTMAKANAARGKLMFRPTYDVPEHVRNLKLTTAAPEDAAEWGDRVFAEMPPFDWQPSADRHGNMPRTMDMLGAGETVRIVMLGDSVVNDMGNAPVGPTIQRHYPGSTVQAITSVRSNGSCEYYQAADNVRKWVLSYEPDLVMIGGISNHGDMKAIRNVIRQVRAASPADVMLATPAPPIGNPTGDGSVDTEHTPEDTNGPDYAGNLRRLAEEESTEFLDMTAAWVDYARTMGPPYSYLMRDSHHINVRGRQLTTRMLERYFAPKS